MRITEIKDNQMTVNMTDEEYIEVKSIAKEHNVTIETLFNYYIKEGLIKDGAL